MNTPEESAEAILKTLEMDCDCSTCRNNVGALASLIRQRDSEVYEAGRQSMAKEIGHYTRVDPATIIPQSVDADIKWTGNPVQTSRGN